MYQKLFKVCTNENFDICSFLTWFKHGNNRARDGAVLCYLQDENAFWRETSNCLHCTAAQKLMGHLATKCVRILGHDYQRKQNDAPSCSYRGLCNKYNMKMVKKLCTHSVQAII
ncbi:hypothetical protein NUSPORA_01582 [Nucleospora cyclopteri]